MTHTITDINGQQRPAPALPSEAADAIIALGWDDDGWPRAKAEIGWAVVFGMPDGTVHTVKGLDYREARQLIRHRWSEMTADIEAGLRIGARKVRGRWVITERCSDGVVRTFTAPDRASQRQAFRPLLSTQTRFEVLQRDGFRCRYCGNGPEDVRLHVDHVHPKSKGGSDELDNLVTACSDCNVGKLDREGVQVP